MLVQVAEYSKDSFRHFQTETRPWMEDQIIKYSDQMQRINKLPEPGTGQYTSGDVWDTFRNLFSS
jgi:hypothetical protein